MSETELKPDEFHPMASVAKEWLAANIHKVPQLPEILASSALAGNRSAKICLETFNRIMAHQPVSDRYFLGLAWLVRDLVDAKSNIVQKDIAERILSANSTPPNSRQKKEVFNNEKSTSRRS